MTEQPHADHAGEPEYRLAPPGGDVLAPPRRRRRASGAQVLLAAAAVLAVLVAGTGVAAYRTLSGGGPQPETLVPANSFAFAKVDLDPAAKEKVAIYRFSRKFAGSPTAAGGVRAEDVRDVLLRSVVDSAGEGVSYDADVKPWLGDRAAVAGFLDAAGRPQAELVLAHRDRAAAERALARLAAKDATVGYVVGARFAVIAASTAVAQEAVRLAGAGSLAGSDRYRSDVAKLHDGQVVTGWADLAATATAVQSVAGGSNSFGSLVPGLGPLAGLGGTPAAPGPGAGTLAPTGRLVVGLRAEADYVELEARTLGQPAAGKLGRAPADLLRRLPGSTVAAVAFGDLSESVSTGVRQLKASPVGDVVTGALGALESETGLAVPDDFVALLGDRAVVAVEGVDGDLPRLALRSHPTAPARARDAAAKLQRWADGNGFPLTVRNAGSDLVVADDEGYAAAVAADGDLGSSARFRRAMGPLDGGLLVAGYVDLGRAFAQTGGDVGAAKALTAVGFSVAADGGSGVLRLRVVAE